MNFPQLPAESGCGSLFPETGHNQKYHKITSQNVHEIKKNMEQDNKELKALLFKSR